MRVPSVSQTYFLFSLNNYRKELGRGKPLKEVHLIFFFIWVSVSLTILVLDKTHILVTIPTMFIST